MTTKSSQTFTTEIVRAGGDTAAERKANAFGAAADLLNERGVAHTQAGFRPSYGWSVKIVKRVVK